MSRMEDFEPKRQLEPKEYIKGLVSKDNLRGPKRFLLGLYAPGKTTNSTQLVIRLTPIPAADPNAEAAGASSLRTSRPLTLDEAEPYGVYFFQSSMLRVLTREGIRPKKKSQPGRSSLLKVQPTDNPGPVGSSQLRGRSDACFLIDFFFLLYAAWVRSRAERPSVSYTKVVMEVAWTGHNLQFTKTN